MHSMNTKTYFSGVDSDISSRDLIWMLWLLMTS